MPERLYFYPEDSGNGSGSDSGGPKVTAKDLLKIIADRGEKAKHSGGEQLFGPGFFDEEILEEGEEVEMEAVDRVNEEAYTALISNNPSDFKKLLEENPDHEFFFREKYFHAVDLSKFPLGSAKFIDCTFEQCTFPPQGTQGVEFINPKANHCFNEPPKFEPIHSMGK